MNKNLLVGIGVVVAIVLSGFALLNAPADGKDGINVGAVSSPDILSPYFSFGGNRYWAYSQDMRQASSTLCSIQAPAASSTLESLTAGFSTTAGYATAYAWGNDPTAFSTTTIIVAPYGFAASARGEIVASTTKVTAFLQNGIVPPLTYINLKLSTTTAGASATYAPVGTCKAVFKEVI